MIMMGYEVLMFRHFFFRLEYSTCMWESIFIVFTKRTSNIDTFPSNIMSCLNQTHPINRTSNSFHFVLITHYISTVTTLQPHTRTPSTNTSHTTPPSSTLHPTPPPPNPLPNHKPHPYQHHLLRKPSPPLTPHLPHNVPLRIRNHTLPTQRRDLKRCDLFIHHRRGLFRFLAACGGI